MKFIKIGDAVINTDFVESVTLNKVGDEVEGVRVFMAESRLKGEWFVIKNETLDSMLEKLNRVPESLRMAHPPQLKSESMLHDIDCYFDNSNNTKRGADNLIQSIYEQLTGEFKATDLSEWQPDWSQAPRGDVVGWKMKTKEQAIWLAQDGGYYLAPSFGYQGNWKDSLRKRPEGK